MRRRYAPGKNWKDVSQACLFYWIVGNDIVDVVEAKYETECGLELRAVLAQPVDAYVSVERRPGRSREKVG
jgi:hypothetical protein